MEWSFELRICNVHNDQGKKKKISDFNGLPDVKTVKGLEDSKGHKYLGKLEAEEIKVKDVKE